MPVTAQLISAFVFATQLVQYHLRLLFVSELLRTPNAVNFSCDKAYISFSRISYLEIYNETMFDLLSTLPESWSQVTEGQQMSVSENEDGTYVKGLSCHLVQNEEEALNLLFEVRIIKNLT